MSDPTNEPRDKIAPVEPSFFRFHLPHTHLASVFGDNWFAVKAEQFARFFGTPKFLISQTLVVAIWIAANVAGLVAFDLYPFILLNLAFSLQAAYAAPLILLAQTRQADRDKLNAIADAQHREDLHQILQTRQDTACEQNVLLLQMLERNTALTETVMALTQRVQELAEDLHKHGMDAESG